MATKDNFSSQSDKYAKYRPTYPAAFFNYLNMLIINKQNAWDCGTGNGQVAYELAKNFDHVFATDISQSQIDNALQAGNINYSVQPSENTNFDNQLFDLVIVAQAIHWFNFDQFYKEVRRTAKPGALLCVLGYGRVQVSAPIDAVITDFYTNVIGKYWDQERRYIDEHYATIPFPFEEIPTPRFENRHQWSLEHLIGYLNTWSAVKHFTKQNGYNPVDQLESEIESNWGSEAEKEVVFPLLLRAGKVH
ncbi:class I SAM-dependent methyltransferase [Niabella yanshanensis]|uniref:Class I SAM-dependent methyltransferase n=1 Tax=Niabella yanshanensis TaxID=577386 RepID=A0ABZ0W3K1_9BACT|nr:class I SAM-dependent methyltransferase [Niabella yanshanensis]WQD37124.1 class I SAM-dependent methyltransferase [Niabella yanshanensis]